MANFKVFDKKTSVEVDEALIGTVSMTDGSGRKHVTVRQPGGDKQNVAIVNSNGTIESQPDFDVRVE